MKPDNYGQSRSMNKRLRTMGKPLPAGYELDEAADLVKQESVKKPKKPIPTQDCYKCKGLPNCYC